MLTVLGVAYPLAPIGPDAVGGAEQVLFSLDRALVRAGHRSVVVACQGSSAAGQLIATRPVPGGEIGEAERSAAQNATRFAIENVLRREHVDVVHMHGIDFFSYLPPSGPPVLVTLHLPPSWYPPEVLSPARPDTWLHCVSISQHRACPPGARLLAPIENGVAVEDFALIRHARRGFALMLARICPEKGIHLALQAAHAAGAPLLIGGELFGYPEHRAYFEREVAPLLDRRRRFLGPIRFARKRRLLAAARCLLVPSLAPETSSLVAMEALASGTPVIAFPSGALADIVAHGRTGFLVRDIAEMAAAIRNSAAIDPAACRAEARARFSEARMLTVYLGRYAELAARAAA